MPLYRFQCPSCQHISDVLRAVTERDERPVCGCVSSGSQPMERLITAPARVWHPSHSVQYAEASTE